VKLDHSFGRTRIEHVSEQDAEEDIWGSNSLTERTFQLYFAKYHCGDLIKEDEMGRHARNVYKTLVGKRQERDHLET
jgi:hypothetical protein